MMRTRELPWRGTRADQATVAKVVRTWSAAARRTVVRCLPSWWRALLAFDDLGRRRRVKAMPLRGRFASLDPLPPAKGRQL